MAIKNPSRGSGGVKEESTKRLDSKAAGALGGGATSGPGGENGNTGLSFCLFDLDMHLSVRRATRILELESHTQSHLRTVNEL